MNTSRTFVTTEIQKRLKTNRELIKEVLDTYEKIYTHQLLWKNKFECNLHLEWNDTKHILSGSSYCKSIAIWDALGEFREKKQILKDIELDSIEFLSDDKVECNFITSGRPLLLKSEPSPSYSYSFFSLASSVLEYFLNSQKCFERLKELLNSAKERNRHSLIEKYTNKLSKLTFLKKHEL